MKTLSIHKAIRYVAPPLLSTSLFVSVPVLAMPLQGTVSTTSKPVKETALHTKAEAGSLAKNSVLVRNTTAKSAPVSTTTATTVQKNEDKKTISRCWKRLMTMVREVSHNHRTKSR